MNIRLFFLKDLLVTFFVMIVFILFVGCNGKKVNAKIIHSNSFWRSENIDKNGTDTLFIDSVAAQVNYYKDGKVDSFIILPNASKSCPGLAGPTDSMDIRKSLSYWVDRRLFTNDSILIFIWKPVEEGYTYKFQMLKDNKPIWEKECSDLPFFPFIFPYSSEQDTLNHVFTMKHWVIKGKKLFGPYIKEPWNEKNRKLRFDFN